MKRDEQEERMITRRTLARTGALGLAGAIAAPRIARGEARRWRMVTSWPKRLPGPGMSAERVAERMQGDPVLEMISRKWVVRDREEGGGAEGARR
jgi:TRAP-type mannitol/chloroaromatic compound transport system substrate-binding protein